MTDAEYIAYELRKGTPHGVVDGTCQIKVRGPEGESRWVTLTQEQYAALTTALTTESENGS